MTSATAGGLVSSTGEVALVVLLLRPLALVGNSSECSESSFLESFDFSTALLLVDVRLDEVDVLAVSREAPLRPFLLPNLELVAFSSFSSPDSAVTDVGVSESEVLALLYSFASSDPSLLPRLRPLVPLRELEAFASDLLSSSTRCKTASSYAASREFIVERRLVEVMSLWL